MQMFPSVLSAFSLWETRVSNTVFSSNDKEVNRGTKPKQTQQKLAEAALT